MVQSYQVMERDEEVGEQEETFSVSPAAARRGIIGGACCCCCCAFLLFSLLPAVLGYNAMGWDQESVLPEISDTQKAREEALAKEAVSAMEDFHVAFTLFVQGIERPGSVSTDDVNDWIVRGNTHLIRLQILLGDLGGRRIDFFASQGGGDGFGDIDF